jgi:hypothetical protein
MQKVDDNVVDKISPNPVSGVVCDCSGVCSHENI